jgi:rhodanese-related sulfurtransferase
MASRRIAARIEYLDKHPLTPQQAMQRILDGSVPLDTRERSEFLEAYVPASINIPARLFVRSNRCMAQIRRLIPRSLPIVLVSELSAATGLVLHCLLKDRYRIVGCMRGGIAAWQAAGLPVASGELRSILPVQLYDLLRSGWAPTVVDVSAPEEYAAGHVPEALTIPLDQLGEHIQELDAQRPIVLICASGMRCRRAALQLANQGFKEVYRVVGGTAGWIRTGLPVVKGCNFS